MNFKTLLVGFVGCLVVTPAAKPQPALFSEERVVVESEGWELVGDLTLPAPSQKSPAVLLLNKADGDRTVYRDLARHLADRAVASLRLDLRGHGESTNLGRFVPGEVPSSHLIWDSEVDVIAAIEFLKRHRSIDADRIGLVGASYSGEEMAEAGRLAGYEFAYVALSPGSFSDESIQGIDASGVPWLFVVSRDERHLLEITAAVQRESRTVEMMILPGFGHATRLLNEYPDLAERIAVWLAAYLNIPRTPGARYGHELVFDEARRQTILFGGFGPDGQPKGDTWLWDGRMWRFATNSGPGPRRWPAAAYDSKREAVVLFGGREGVGRDGQSFSDTWIWDGSAWTRAYVGGPAGRDHHRMVYDRARDRIVMFGGWDGEKVVGDTWQWDGESWTLTSSAGPSARAPFGMAYHQAEEMVVLMGGQNLEGSFDDTWTWDGSDWVKLEIEGPDRRSFQAMTYDPLQTRILLYGGRDQDHLYTDLWSWDEGNWTRLDDDGPVRRGIYAAAFDPIRGNLVFHGSGDLVDGNWQLDSTTWVWTDSTRWQLASTP